MAQPEPGKRWVTIRPPHAPADATTILLARAATLEQARAVGAQAGGRVWLFLATEVMFFTGLIGSYIVLRTGSPREAYSNLYSPATELSLLRKTEGVLIGSAGADFAP